MNKPKIKKTKQAITKGKPKITKGGGGVDQLFDASHDLDPLKDVAYVGELEADTEAEVSALLAGFRQRAKQEQDRFKLATDTEFWFSVCFQSREQKEIFLAAMDWVSNGDKFLDGLKLAAQHGVDLPEVKLPKPKGVSKKLKALPSIRGK